MILCTSSDPRQSEAHGEIEIDDLEMRSPTIKRTRGAEHDHDRERTRQTRAAMIEDELGARVLRLAGVISGYGTVLVTVAYQATLIAEHVSSGW